MTSTTTIPQYVSQQPTTIEDLIQKIYVRHLLERAVIDATAFIGQVIAAPKNDIAIEINSEVISRFSGRPRIHEARNSCTTNEDDSGGYNLVP